MNPEDPRHGKYAGAVAHWLENGERPCDDCARAEWRYRKTRKLRHLRGDLPTVSSTGTIRRIEALFALGWSGPKVAEAAGISVATIRAARYHKVATVHAATARAIVRAYDTLSMSRPEGHYADRARRMAQRKGWLPPLAWDDDSIDDPAAKPLGTTAPRHIPKHDVDPVVVERLLAGQRIKATKAEKDEAMRRWLATGRPARQLLEAQGWKDGRYGRDAA